MQQLAGGVRRSRNRAVVRMIHDVFAARAAVMLKRDGRNLQERGDTEGPGLHATRVALLAFDAHHSASLDEPGRIR
jgi:hypothetical protein